MGNTPQIAIWENVYGAYSSTNGEDFRTVLETLCQVCDQEFSVPRYEERGGKQRWSKSGCIMADDFSLAWRGLDAQHWGVAQKRKRVFIVLDLGGQCAAQILFEREGLSRNFKTVRGTREIARPVAETSFAEHDRFYAVENHSADSRVTIRADGVFQTLTSRMGTGGGNVPLILTPCALTPAYGQTSYDDYTPMEQSVTLKARGGNYGGGTEMLILQSLDCGNDQTLFLPVEKTQGEVVYLVRKLTPTECASLQGFAKDWCSKVPHKDSAEYKMWGNGMAFPCMLYIMEGVQKVLTERFLAHLIGGDTPDR